MWCIHYTTALAIRLCRLFLHMLFIHMYFFMLQKVLSRWHEGTLGTMHLLYSASDAEMCICISEWADQPTTVTATCIGGEETRNVIARQSCCCCGWWPRTDEGCVTGIAVYFSRHSVWYCHCRVGLSVACSTISRPQWLNYPCISSPWLRWLAIFRRNDIQDFYNR